MLSFLVTVHNGVSYISIFLSSISDLVFRGLSPLLLSLYRTEMEMTKDLTQTGRVTPNVHTRPQDAFFAARFKAAPKYVAWFLALRIKRLVESQLVGRQRDHGEHWV